MKVRNVILPIRLETGKLCTVALRGHFYSCFSFSCLLCVFLCGSVFRLSGFVLFCFFCFSFLELFVFRVVFRLRVLCLFVVHAS